MHARTHARTHTLVQADFVLLKAALLAVSVAALRHRPRLFGWLIFLAAGHACQTIWAETLPFRLAAPLTLLAVAALASAPLAAGAACDMSAMQVRSRTTL